MKLLGNLLLLLAVCAIPAVLVALLGGGWGWVFGVLIGSLCAAQYVLQRRAKQIERDG